MKANVDYFIVHIEEVFGTDYKIHKFNAKDEGKPIYLFIFRGIPEVGMITFITFGLSEGQHPEWISGKPELILSLETNDETWGHSIAWLAAELRGIKPFSYGDKFTFGEPICEGTSMIGYFVFSPSILDKDIKKIETTNLPIFLTGMYPIYKEEVELINEIGLKEFWFSNGFDLYNPKRVNITLNANS
ncbi:suppressor of fused domain protein [Paenibacillus periandrae]|uniref:suppressor of fused domain protein n=1 Tax=Paenibacillus periandrae TaxID=1761741 RepID=UPI001F09C8A6|nr:suppressor of fused domain protein [Paenibacillus periandrae]